MDARLQGQKRMFLSKKVRKILGVSTIILLFIVSALLIGGYFFLKKSLPQIEGEVVLPQLEQKVAVTRDENGVPHIKAESMKDLYFAQGFVTAQDRLFQMDLSRRQASGQLSEVIGSSLLEQDKFFRTLGLRRAAEESYHIYSEEAKQVLQWYADGVNAFMKQSIEENTLPIEFTLAGYEPTEWTPIDSLTIGKYMAYDLGGHWEGQAFRYYMAEHFPEEKVKELFPVYPEDGATILQVAKDNPIDVVKSFADVKVPDEFYGSNNWVVSGERTESGFPILANDPHLALGTPSIWYESHLSGPDVNVSGVIFAGVPGIIVGHNEHIAWGVTNVGPDVQDLYIEKRNPENEHEFEYMGKWEKATQIIEEIKVKDESPVEYEVVVTRHGPIISEFAHDERPETALSIRWTALDPSTELEAVLKFNQATSWDEFKEALTFFHTPAQNFVFAANDGTIAYRANGLIPIRKNGDSSMPVPGWTDEYEWEGYIPWDELPTIENPEEGFISTANNKVVDDSYPYHITNTWAQPYRQQRIRDVLAENEKVTVKDMEDLHFDQYNLQAEEFVPILLYVLKQNEPELRDIDKEVIDMLEDWRYYDSVDEPGPIVFHRWRYELASVLFDKDIPKEIIDMFEGKDQIIDEMIRKAVDGEEGIWLQDAGGIHEVTTVSFQRAVDFAVKEQGKNPTKWKWGEFHEVPFKHPLSAISPLQYLFNYDGATPVGGSRVTVMAASFDNNNGRVTNGGAWRTVIDTKNMNESFNIVGPGQTGHVLSEWYHDQVDNWTTGGYHLTTMDPNEIKGHVLYLVPRK